MSLVSLYKKDSRGEIRLWEVEVDGDELIKRYGVHGGEIIEHSEIVDPNTLRDSEEQALEKMDQEIRKRLDRGYHYSVEEAESSDNSVNQIGLFKPMLAERIDKVKNVDPETCHMQYKYDGHRCLITNQDGENIAYSRNGKIIDSVPEILSQIQIPEGVTLDGELYAHGEHLQTISSWVKRKQDNTDQLNFVMYDTVMDKPYEQRFDFLQGLDVGNRVILADHVQFSGDLSSDLSIAKSLGYEGLILRQSGFGYQHKRSKGLIKVKSCIDTECVVTEINPSKDGWAILTCLFGAKTFTVSAPGDVPTKTRTLINRELYIGKMVTVEYACLTKDGVPFHPVATMWRDKSKE